MRFTYFVIVFFCLIGPVMLKAGNQPVMPDYTIRKGLPTVYQKLKSGRPVTIAFLGGSITEAAKGWRDQSTESLKHQFPKATITSINAGIGGTGSDLGVFRLKPQVLDFNPDLVFVEFAVNDVGKPTARIYQTMEGIVRQIWKKNAGTDICFVYTLTGDMAAEFQAGKVPPSTAAMEVIADYYGIPSVSMGLKAVQMASAGNLIFKGKKEDFPGKMVFSADNVHPFPETGHRIYAEALNSALNAIFKSSKKQAKTRLIKPFTADNWEAAKMVDISEVTTTGKWEPVMADNAELARVFKKPFTQFIKASEPEASLSFTYKGQLAGLYDVVGPGCGQYEVTLDGKPGPVIPRFDAYATYYRPQYFFLTEAAPGEHTVKLSVSTKPLDKKVILQKRSQVMDNESRFQENACYAGYVLLIGDLVK